MLADVKRNTVTTFTVQNSPTVYFENFMISCITLYPIEKKNYFGNNINGKFHEKLEGKILIKAWLELPKLFPECKLGFYSVKENEFSGMITIDDSSNQNSKKLLPIILSSFKARSTKLLNQLHGTHGRIFWKNNYQEFSIKDLNDLNTALLKIRN